MKCILLCSFALMSSSGYAQLKIFEPKTPRDSGYVYNYYGNITLRAYLVNKYSAFTIANGGHRLWYSTNTPFGVGIGGIYKIYNFNLTYGLPLPQVYKESRGKSRAIDLQSSLYGRKWVFDLYFQLYKGYYTSNYAGIVPDEYILKPNLRNNTLGVTAHYLFNSSGFSYRAFRVNDEWQHRSSGTFFLSFAAFFNDLYDKDRVGFIPPELSDGQVDHNVYRKMTFAFGPGLGYAYNFVYKKNWFVLGSFSGRLMYDFGQERSVQNEEVHPQGFKTGYSVLGAIGYQNARWGVNISAMNTVNRYNTELLINDYKADMGYIKLNVLFRIPHTSFTRKIIQPFDYFLRK